MGPVVRFENTVTGKPQYSKMRKSAKKLPVAGASIAIKTRMIVKIPVTTFAEMHVNAVPNELNTLDEARAAGIIMRPIKVDTHL
mmetsp:Transcript_16605/g.24540  ORF Transcript_16605/g.24540 Transcript_16605/m.24540 type:complete len:84 (-) Transcript_16605:1059-1310(-)